MGAQKKSDVRSAATLLRHATHGRTKSRACVSFFVDVDRITPYLFSRMVFIGVRS